MIFDLLVSLDGPGPPDAPIIDKIFVNNCMCAYQPPKNDSGAPIIGYHVEKRLVGSQFWAGVNKEPVSATNCLIIVFGHHNPYDVTKLVYFYDSETHYGTGAVLMIFVSYG